MKRLYGLVLVSLLLTGCQSARYESGKTEAEARRCSPQPNKAVLYLYQCDEKAAPVGPARVFLSSGGSFEKTQTASELALLPGQSFVRMELDPGEYGLLIAHTLKGGRSELMEPPALQLQADQVYFLEFQVRRGVAWLAGRSREIAESRLTGLRMAILSPSGSHAAVLSPKQPSFFSPHETYIVIQPDGSRRTYFIQKAGPRPMDTRVFY